MSHVTCRMSHVTCLMSNAYVDPWDMLNNFCFHVYAQMSLFMGENGNDFLAGNQLHELQTHREGDSGAAAAVKKKHCNFRQ